MQFVRIHNEVLLGGGSDGGIAGPFSERTVRSPKPVKLQGDVDEDYEQDADDGISSVVRLRREQLRAKWRLKGSGVLSPSLQQSAHAAYKDTAAACLAEVTGSPSQEPSEGERSLHGPVSIAALRALQAE